MEKIIADRVKGILVITGIGSTPCPLEGLKSTLDSITLNEMSFGPDEELFIDVKGLSMPFPGQASGTEAFLVLAHANCTPLLEEKDLKNDRLKNYFPWTFATHMTQIPPKKYNFTQFAAFFSFCRACPS